MDSGPSTLSGGQWWRSDRPIGGRGEGHPVGWLPRLAQCALLMYPRLVSYGLMHWPIRAVALLSMAFFVALVALRGRGERASYGELLASATLAVLAGIAFVLDVGQLMLAFPVIINLMLLAAFSTSLRWGVPVVERFARLQSAGLGEDEVQY